jgi:hypothetical protein
MSDSNNTRSHHTDKGHAAEQGDDSGGLREQVREAMDARDTSQRKLGKELGFSASAVNKWLDGKYTGDNAKVAAAAETWLAKRATRGTRKESFVETPTSERILAALSHAQLIGDMVAVYGGPGVGKTSAVRHYQHEQPERVWVATMTPASAGLVSALETVSDAIHLRDVGGGARRLSGAIQARVAGTRGLLIIDEAQHLSMHAVNQLRSIHDATDIGLAFVGNENSFSRLTGGQRVANYTQIHSRIGMRVFLPRPTAEDVVIIARAWGVTDKDAIEFLRRVAAKPGALRAATKLLRLILLRRGKVTVETLRTACQALGAEV